jgi:hypothetical protein
MAASGVSAGTAARRLDVRRQWAVALAMSFLLGGCVTSALANEDVAFEVLGGDQCFMFSLLVPKKLEGERYVTLPLQLVINDEDAYRKLFDPKIATCAEGDLPKAIPKVDFSKKTVLGLWSSGSCAATGFERRVLRVDILKSIVYSVALISSARGCLGPGLRSLNLIAIPKVPEGYQVTFENIPE